MGTMTDTHEVARLQSCEKAWSACYTTLLAGNPDMSRQPATGLQCAVREIERLQKLASRVALLEAEVAALQPKAAKLARILAHLEAL